MPKIRIIGPTEEEQKWIDNAHFYLLYACEKYTGLEILRTARELCRLLQRTVSEINARARRPENKPIDIKMINELSYDTPVWYVFPGDDRAFVECADIVRAELRATGAKERTFYLYKPTSEELTELKRRNDLWKRQQ